MRKHLIVVAVVQVFNAASAYGQELPKYRHPKTAALLTLVADYCPRHITIDAAYARDAVRRLTEIGTKELGKKLFEERFARETKNHMSQYKFGERKWCDEQRKNFDQYGPLFNPGPLQKK